MYETIRPHLTLILRKEIYIYTSPILSIMHALKRLRPNIVHVVE